MVAPVRAGWRVWLRRGAVGVVVLTLALSPWWGRTALRQLAYFKVQRVEIEGARYVIPDQVVSRLRLDSTSSVWDAAGEYERRVAEHPGVRTVRITRRLPGTLVVSITEVPPVGLAPSGSGLAAFDSAGHPLPIDPTAVDVDLPVLATRDTTVLRLLGELRQRVPQLYARVDEVRRGPRREVVLRTDGATVLAAPDADAARLADVLLVEADLARRGLRAQELDLRYRDQVVARLP